MILARMGIEKRAPFRIQALASFPFVSDASRFRELLLEVPREDDSRPSTTFSLPIATRIRWISGRRATHPRAEGEIPKCSPQDTQKENSKRPVQSQPITIDSDEEIPHPGVLRGDRINPGIGINC